MITASAAKPTYDRREIIILGVIAIVALVVRLTFLHEPFERDEGYYACIAQEILRGGIPYRDAIDMKPPGVFYIFALAIALFGATVESIRIFTALYTLGTLLAVYWLARRIQGTVAGLCAAAMFALYSGAPLVQGSSSNSEVFMVLPLVMSAALFVRWLEEGKRVFLCGSALFAGLAMLVKTVALPYVALLFVFSLLKRGSETRMKQGVINAVTFVAPLVLLAAFTLGYFFLKGALKEFIAWNVTIPYFYSKGGGVFGPPLAAVLTRLAPELFLPALAAVPTSLWLLFGRRDLKSMFIALLLPASCLGVWLPGKFFPHYFIQLYPFLSILAGIGLAKVFEARGMFRWVAGTVVAASFLFYAVKEYKLFFVYSPEQVSVIKYGPTFAESVYIADYIKKRTSPTDYIFQWGFEPELYFLADRRIPVPYISSTVLGSYKDPEPAIRSMTVNLQTKKPKYIIVQPGWADWPGILEVKDIVAKNYKFETRMGYALIYQRLY